MDRLTVEAQYRNHPKTLWQKIFVILIVLVILNWSMMGLQFKGISKSGLMYSRNILRGIVTPSIDQLINATDIGVPYLLLETISIAFLGTLIGALISIPFAFLTARNMTNRLFSTIGVIIITLIRTFPTVIYGLMFIRVTGPGAFAGVLTLAVTSVGMISKLYIEVIEDLDKGIIEALDASGCTNFQKIRYGIIPQLSTNFISTAIYRFEINIKNATVLGLVGAGKLGSAIIFALGDQRWNDLGAILFGLIILVLLVEYFSTKLRRKLATGE